MEFSTSKLIPLRFLIIPWTVYQRINLKSSLAQMTYMNQHGIRIILESKQGLRKFSMKKDFRSIT